MSTIITVNNINGPALIIIINRPRNTNYKTTYKIIVSKYQKMVSVAVLIVRIDEDKQSDGSSRYTNPAIEQKINPPLDRDLRVKTRN